jgi:hypothetical protein
VAPERPLITDPKLKSAGKATLHIKSLPTQ